MSEEYDDAGSVGSEVGSDSDWENLDGVEPAFPLDGADFYTMQSVNGMVTITPAGKKEKFANGTCVFYVCFLCFT